MTAGEQGLLFQLYHQLSEGEIRCVVKNCDGTIARNKLDFFALFVSKVKSTRENQCSTLAGSL
jgi:hypothetical protein